jgi:hypothetical protein
MSQFRKPQTESSDPRTAAATLLAGETLRKTAEPPAAAPPKGEERISLFWRVFGGTLLSIAALVVMTVYQQFAAGMNDLRATVTHLDSDSAKKTDVTELRGMVVHVNEVNSEMARKEDLNTKVTGLWNLVKETGNDASGLKTRTTVLEEKLKAAEDDRKDLKKELQDLREKLIALEGRLAAPTKPAGGE